MHYKGQLLNTDAIQVDLGVDPKKSTVGNLGIASRVGSSILLSSTDPKLNLYTKSNYLYKLTYTPLNAKKSNVTHSQFTVHIISHDTKYCGINHIHKIFPRPQNRKL